MGWSTANYAKVVPISRIEDCPLQLGSFYKKARKLYWGYGHG
jgi:branched-chain amino acid aminotransferase